MTQEIITKLMQIRTTTVCALCKGYNGNSGPSVVGFPLCKIFLARAATELKYPKPYPDNDFRGVVGFAEGPG